MAHAIHGEPRHAFEEQEAGEKPGPPSLRANIKYYCGVGKKLFDAQETGFSALGLQKAMFVPKLGRRRQGRQPCVTG
jgi:hypothetical protein